ncbi:NIPSNAP family protein [Schlesneria paludicola]|uniref:NIPSNAP family protein n=1 Tax=Schlesneria paludicola TaxID=360056 RepID=UPI00029B29CB|nr:NIPSNAP family protein [Schlesneria paludicola]
MSSVKTLVAAIALVGMGVGIGWSVKPVSAEPEKPTYVYEMRTYTTLPGKLPALHARFRDHTVKLFERHGMKNVIYLTPVDADGKPVDNKLVYLLAHKSQAAAKASFDAFRKDAEWIAARDASEKDGPILVKPPENVVSVFYTPTDYSPMK